jgi:energy-coupling factor transporter transmembrane protein EcfT
VTRRPVRWLGPGSYLAFLVWVLFLVALLPDAQIVPLLIAVFVFGLLNGGQGLFILRKARFWILILSIVAVSPWILGEVDLTWGWLHLSRTGLEMGLWMALRAICLSLAFSVSTGALSASELARLFEGAGLKGLGFSLGVALNLLGTLGTTIEAAYHTIRLRGGFRRPWLALRLFLITVIANALRYGDDVVRAASARGFDPAVQRRTTPLFRRADSVFALGLLGLGGVLLLWPW